MRYGWAVLLFVGVGIGLSGCSSSSTEPAIDQVLEPRIEEYVGDGGGSLKPWPDFLGLSAVDSPAVVAPKLKYAAPPKIGKVARKQVSWYRLQANNATPHWIVTLQPATDDEDTDLYVLEGKAKDFDDGAETLAYSRRDPSRSDTITGRGAPDWVCLTPDPSAGWPAGHVAVLGVNEDPAVKHFWIELDGRNVILANGGTDSRSVSQYDSHWFVLNASLGAQYTVTLQDTGAGDPDLYVYGGAATKFIGAHANTGNGSVTFTATEVGDHNIRVYGYSPNPNGYTIEVTSP